MKTSLLALLALVAVGCADETETTDLALGQAIVGSWSVSMTAHDNAPCEGELNIAANGVGGWWCVDTAPVSPGLYTITYGTSRWTASGSGYAATVTYHGGSAIFTDTVRISGTSMDGAVIAGDRI